MSYSAEINRENPTCIVFLIDQSKSMSRPFGKEPEKQKAAGVADAINRLIQTLCITCARADGMHEYFRVGVVGYGRTVRSELESRFGGRGLAPIGEISRNPLRVETRERLMDDGAGGVLRRELKFPIWFEPVASGKTPMKQALHLARDMVASFLEEHPNCYPPLVMNITDGRADEDPMPAADDLKALESSDGRVLLFNAHLSEQKNTPIKFPQSDAHLPDNFAKLLFRMSSVLPPKAVEAVREAAEGTDAVDDLGPASRGFVFNADLVEMIQFLDIGTKSSMGAVRP